MPVDVPCTGARSADFPLVLKAWSLTETHVPPRRSQRTGPRGVLGEAPTESRDATRTPPIRFPSGRAQRRPRVERLARCTPCGSPRARWGASAPVGAPAPHSLVSLILLPEDLYDVIRVERRVQGPRGSSAWKSGPPAMVLTRTPSLWMLRTTARNRVGNQLARTPGGESARRRSQRLRTRFTLFAPHAANRSPTQGQPGEPPHRRRFAKVHR